MPECHKSIPRKDRHCHKALPGDSPWMVDLTSWWSRPGHQDVKSTRSTSWPEQESSDIWHLGPGAEYWLIFLARVPDTTPYRIIGAVLSPGCWHGALELSCESVGRKGSNPQQHQIVSFFPKMRLWDLAQLNSWWYCKGSTGFTLESCLASIWKHKIGHSDSAEIMAVVGRLGSSRIAATTRGMVRKREKFYGYSIAFQHFKEVLTTLAVQFFKTSSKIAGSEGW